MSHYNNNNNQEMVAVLEWSTTMKRSIYSPSELFQLRKPSKDGTGYCITITIETVTKSLEALV